MVIWLNGPFGVGKTSLARGLSTHLKPSLIYDPEYLGFALRRSHDFQDVRIWRTLTGLIGGLLGRYRRGHVIIPMTVSNPVYLNEIFGLIAEREVQISHYYLELNESDLKSRIESDKRIVREQKIREWRLSQLERCLNARGLMPPETIFLSAKKPVLELTAEIHADLLRSCAKTKKPAEEVNRTLRS